MKVNIAARGDEVTGSVGSWDFMIARPPQRNDHPGPSVENPGVRSGFAFYLRGKDAALRVKDVKLEIAPK